MTSQRAACESRELRSRNVRVDVILCLLGENSLADPRVETDSSRGKIW